MDGEMTGSGEGETGEGKPVGEVPAGGRRGYHVFVDTVCDGPVPIVSDEDGPVVFATELEAQVEIVEHLIERLEQFLAGEREYDDAVYVDEYVVEVREDGKC